MRDEHQARAATLTIIGFEWIKLFTTLAENHSSVRSSQFTVHNKQLAINNRQKTIGKRQ
jgi:hypothetical protein